MKFLGNLVWFLFGGLWMGLGWTLVGLLWCVTIVGIPVGLQCFKFASIGVQGVQTRLKRNVRFESK